jgi:bis(5'-nucleosidyl)-tetraphosphatase
MKVSKRSAGAVIVRPSGDGLRCLLLRCYGYWDCPKGEVEPGEDPLDTARREVREETGLDDLAFPWGHGCIETPPYGRGKVARYYLAQSAQGEVVLPVSPELGTPEHHEFRWVTFEQGRALVNQRLRAVLDWAEATTSAPGLLAR